MNTLDPASLLPHVEAIARLAGAEVMVHYNKGTGVYTKDDNSPVTDADKASEAIILPRLAALAPDIPIVSEEMFSDGARPDVSGGTFWTVDPIDGTKEFINKTGAFVIAIALVVDNKPVLGVIYHPAFDIMYASAGAGTAAKIGADGVRTPLGASAGESDEKPARVVTNLSSTNMPLAKGYLSIAFGEAAKVDGTPGILRACQVADNMADGAIIHPVNRNGRTKWWDVAPGHALIESAGGRVQGIDGQPITYDAPDFQVPPLISFSPAFVAKRAKSAQTPLAPKQRKRAP